MKAVVSSALALGSAGVSILLAQVAANSDGGQRMFSGVAAFFILVAGVGYAVSLYKK